MSVSVSVPESACGYAVSLSVTVSLLSSLSLSLSLSLCLCATMPNMRGQCWFQCFVCVCVCVCVCVSVCYSIYLLYHCKSTNTDTAEELRAAVGEREEEDWAREVMPRLHRRHRRRAR